MHSYSPKFPDPTLPQDGLRHRNCHWAIVVISKGFHVVDLDVDFANYACDLPTIVLSGRNGNNRI